MRLRRIFYRWLRASLQPTTLFGLMMIAACWIAVTFLMSIERGKTLEGAIQQSESLVRLFEENTEQTLLGIDRTLLLLRKGFEGKAKDAKEEAGNIISEGFAQKTPRSNTNTPALTGGRI